MHAAATPRRMVVNSNDSAADGRVSPASASASDPSTSILMKAGVPCWTNNASSVVTGTRMVLVQAWPSQPGAPSAALRNASEAVDIELKLEHSRAAADRDRLDRQRGVAAIEQLQRLDQRRLRLDRHHAGAETAKDGDAVADMGADIEHEIAGV